MLLILKYSCGQSIAPILHVGIFGCQGLWGREEVGKVFLAFCGHNKLCTANQPSFEMQLWLHVQITSMDLSFAKPNQWLQWLENAASLSITLFL